MSTLVVSLIAIGIVAATSFGTQLMWMRTTRAQIKKEQQAAARAELKAAIEGFIQAAKVVELLTEQRFFGHRPPKGAPSSSTEMWLRQSFLDILCSSGLQTATFDYALLLGGGLWDEPCPGKDFEPYIQPARTTFLRAARAELLRPEFR